jgi:hypothetical protein
MITKKFLDTPFVHMNHYDWRGNKQNNDHYVHPRDHNYSPEGVFLWLKAHFFRYSFGSDVVIHGHSPTLFFEG